MSNTRVVWKQELPRIESHVEVPRGAIARHVAEQSGKVCLWFECDPQAPLESRIFVTHGTGHNDIGPDEEYVGTLLVDGGAFVFHVYEKVRSVVHG